MWVFFYGVPIRVGHSGERVYRLSSSSVLRLERIPVWRAHCTLRLF